MFRNPHLWKAYQIDRLLNGCGNHQKYQRGCDHRSLSVYPQAAISQSIISISDAGVCRGRRRSDRSESVPSVWRFRQNIREPTVEWSTRRSRMRSSRRSSRWSIFRSLRRLLRFTRMSAANWRRSRYFKCIRRCRHRIDGSRDPEASIRTLPLSRPEDRRTNRFLRRSRQEPMRSRVHAAVQRRAVCADDEEIQGDQSLIIQKGGAEEKT